MENNNFEMKNLLPDSSFKIHIIFLNQDNSVCHKSKLPNYNEFYED